MRKFYQIALIFSILTNILLGIVAYKLHVKIEKMSDLIALFGVSFNVVKNEIPDGDLKSAKEMAIDAIEIITDAKAEFDLNGVGWNHFDFHTKGKVW